MEERIVLPVGRNSTNFAPDVNTVIGLLNSIPEKDGGSSLAVVAPGKALSVNIGPALVGAIERFQKAQFDWTSGLVSPDSATLYRMNQLAARTPSELTSMAGDLRSRVCKIALDQKGRVSDKGLNPNVDDRRGGDFLRQIFDEILTQPHDWNDPTTKLFERRDGDGNVIGAYQITKKQGIMKAHMRIPQDGKGLGISWCGIFAAWLWRRAGLDVKWLLGKGIVVNGSALTLSTNRKALMPGDIATIPASNHHFLIIGLGADGHSLHTLDGNSSESAGIEDQGIIEFPDKRKIKDVNAFYSLDTALDSGVKYPHAKGVQAMPMACSATSCSFGR